MNSLHRLGFAAMLACSALPAPADLYVRPDGLVYDSTQDLTWLQDMDTHGLMNWTQAQSWIASLNAGTGFAGYTDWRLPTTLDGCRGYNCIGSEMGHLFIVDLGEQPGTPVTNHAGDTATQVANFALFSDVKAYAYWSVTVPDVYFSSAWYFQTLDGSQNFIDKTNPLYAIAVRSGDVTSVPEPSSGLTMMLGLAAVAAALKRRVRRH